MDLSHNFTRYARLCTSQRLWWQQQQQQQRAPQRAHRCGSSTPRVLAAWVTSLIALALSAAVLPEAAASPGSVAVQYCPNGGSMETGLCYARCPLGSVGVGCSCWRDGRSTWRGCGVRPRTCRARSFRPPALPPVPAAERGRPFTLLLSADPQLWRNYTKYDDRAGAERINRRLVRSINAVRDLKAWPADAGGGEVEEPRSMVVLGDLTEFYMERQADGFRHFYDPSYPRAAPDDRVRFPTWLMLGVGAAGRHLGCVRGAWLGAAAAGLASLPRGRAWGWRRRVKQARFVQPAVRVHIRILWAQGTSEAASGWLKHPPPSPTPPAPACRARDHSPLPSNTHPLLHTLYYPSVFSCVLPHPPLCARTMTT
jgi:hypothetical protein